MTVLTKRQKEILNLLSHSKEPLTSGWIAKELGVSDRTVRTEIKQIEQSMKKSVIIESIRGKGFVLRKINDTDLSIQQNGNDETGLSGKFLDKDERVFYILRRLLLEKDFIKLENLSNEMFVSLSTLQNDLKDVKEILQKYNLCIKSRPHYGSKIEGDEYMKRLCLSNILLKRDHEEFINEVTFHFIDPNLFKKIKEVIIKKVDKYKIEIFDISLENLATHIAIACRRIQEGFVIGDLSDIVAEEYPFENIVANEIIKEIETISGLKFPKEEINYVIIHLLGTKIINKKELEEFSRFDEVKSIVNGMLNRLYSEFNWDFRDDQEFIQALTLHIRPAMNRIRYKMNIRNPLLHDIKKKYPAAFQGAIIASREIEEYLHMEVIEDEIAYIALHIGVALEKMKLKRKKIKKILIVCASGVGSAKLLFYRLQYLFDQEIKIIDTITYYKLLTYDLSVIDLIISTIPIKEDLGVPVLVVNTFLDEKDIHSIKGFLSMTQNNNISKFLDSTRIFLHQDLSDWESVIRFLCDQLVKQNLVSKNYVELVIERELIAPTSFGNLVAVPHPIKSVTKETFWTVCTLKNPIKWYDDQTVQLVCLLNVNEENQTELDIMFKTLISIIEDKSIVQKIINCKTPNQLLELLENLFKERS